MTLPTHVCFGSFTFLLVLLFLGLTLNPIYILVACVTALLPDLDYPSSTIGRALPFISERLERRFGHRTFTHSLLGGVVFGVISLPLLFWGKKFWLAGMLGYFSHILLDCMNKSGVALFYPDGVQAVLPGKEELRFVHGGKGEAILFFILLGLNLATFPVAQIGLIKSLHYLRADSQSAVADFRDWAKDYQVFCDLRGVDAITNKLVAGKFEVVGAEGASTLIISNAGHLRSAGIKDNVNIRVTKVRCQKKEKINLVVSEVNLKGRPLAELEFYLDQEKEHYLFGMLNVEGRQVLEERPDRFRTVDYVNNNLTFNYANWAEVLKQGLENLEVKEGVVLIKTVLKPGETLKLKEAKAGSGERPKGKFFKVNFQVDKIEDVLVKKDQQIKRGDVLAKMKEEEIRELAKLKDELSYQEDLWKEGVGSQKAVDEVWEKIRKLQGDFRRAKISRFSGRVCSLKFGEVKEGRLEIEVGILSEDPLFMNGRM